MRIFSTQDMVGPQTFRSISPRAWLVVWPAMEIYVIKINITFSFCETENTATNINVRLDKTGPDQTPASPD